MEKVKVSVFVAGQRFNIITDEEEKYVRELAARVDGRINSLAVSQDIGRERAAVLAALDLADDVDHERRNLSEIREQVKDYLTQIEKLSAENDDLKGDLGKAQADASELVEARGIIAERDKEVSALKSEVFALKEQIGLMRKSQEENKAAQTREIPPAADEKQDDAQPAEAVETAAQVIEAPAEEPEQKITAQDDLLFDLPGEEPVKPSPRKDKKNRHEHSHVNPYKQNYMKKQEDKGYTQQRQFSLFDTDEEN